MVRNLIKNKNFCYLWTGQLISSLGDRLTQMGILTFVMVSSQDKGDKMALITFFGLLPFLLFGPLFGALVDRYSRKNLMILADLARALLVLGIPFIWANTHSVLAMVAWFFILGTFTALFTPAKMSIITNITDKDLLLQANSLIVTTGMISTLVGTLIAGALIKATGARLAFYINGLTYFVSALLIYKIVYQKTERLVGQPKTDYGVILADIKSGLAYVARHQLILQLILLSCMFSVISSFAYILILNYGTTVLRQGPLGMGWLLSSAGFGMVAGSAILIKKKDKVCYERVLYFSYLGIGITCLLFFFLVPGVFLTSLILFCAGIAAAVLTITLDTIFQRVTPDELKGKIFALRGVVSNAVFLGCLLLVGLLVKYILAPKIFFLVGIISILTALRILLYEKRWGYQLICVCLRALMKYLFALKVSGGENLPSTRRVILAGNHTSLMDGAVVAAAYPGRVYFLVADTIFKTRIWGWVVKRLGYISIKRGGFNKEAIKEAVAILKSGYSICIFPEGKISADDKLNPGKEGIALIARLANVDIIPFAIEGAHEAWPLPEKFPKRFPVEIRFGSPIDTKDYPLPEELVSEVMEDIAQIKLYLEREGYLRVEPNKIIEQLINIG